MRPRATLPDLTPNTQQEAEAGFGYAEEGGRGGGGTACGDLKKTKHAPLASSEKLYLSSQLSPV